MSYSQGGGSTSQIELQQNSTLGLKVNSSNLRLPFMPGVQVPAGLEGALKADLMNLIRNKSNSKNTGYEMDFWTEEENTRFTNALTPSSDAQNWDVISARVGSKSQEQCQSYYKFRRDALEEMNKNAALMGKAPADTIKAEEIYSCLGIHSDYMDFLDRARQLSFAQASRASAEGGGGGGGGGGGVVGGKSKSSIDFLCGGGGGGGVEHSADRKNQFTSLADSLTPNRSTHSGLMDIKTENSRNSPTSHGRNGGPVKKKVHDNNGNGNAEALGSATGATANGNCNGRSPVTLSSREFAGNDREANGGAGVAGVGGGGGGGAVKRKRPDSPPTKDKDREVDRNRINKRDMWSYACMNQLTKEDLEKEATLDEQQSRERNNPWEWTRKLICRPTGYAQWIGHFAESMMLTKREVSDDMRAIRDKAPLPPLPADRRAGEVVKNPRKDAPVHEWIYNGCMVEVKWESDWWHAKVQKMKPPKGGPGLEKVFVSYVGGSEEDDEWIAVSKIRAPREDVEQKLASKKGGRTGVKPCAKSGKGK